MTSVDANTPEGGWAGPARPRLATPTPAERGIFFRLLGIVARAFGRSEIPDVFTVLHIHRPLFWGWLHFASRLMPFGKLPAQDRERAILRTAWNCRSRYEWGQHVDLGLAAGLTDDAIVRVRLGPAEATDPWEATFLRACDELHAGRTLADATWTALGAKYTPEQIIELVMLVGHYGMLAGFLNSVGIALEPPTEACLSAFEARTEHAIP